MSQLNGIICLRISAVPIPQHSVRGSKLVSEPFAVRQAFGLSHLRGRTDVSPTS
jgi:hypothetical protein